MAKELNAEQLTGREDDHLVSLLSGHRLRQEAAAAFSTLQADALEAGFDLAIASSFRSYQRQLLIWNGKASGARAVYDDAGRPVAMAELSPVAQLHAILRYSAIPGTSRHHWGTDLDVYDAAAVTADYQLQLSPQEVAVGGVFDPLHCWLDERMAAGESQGFFRPYSSDTGGVARERWHLSYAPLAVAYAQQLTEELLVECWDCSDDGGQLLLVDEVKSALPQIITRYVVVARDWCPEEFLV